jgi:radical SAM protein with 4Fe4S-binding SPASM domain
MAIPLHSPTLENAGRTIHQEPTGQVRLVEYEDRFFRTMVKHFGERFVNYRRDWASSSKFEYLPDFPLSLDLETNASCNLKCIMCVMGSPEYHNPMSAQSLLDMALYRSLMSQGRKAGLPAMTFGFLSEPLLRKDLPIMIELARQAGVMDIRLGTNGTLLTQTTSEALLASGLTRLEVSIDAFLPETYRRIRKGGRLDQVVRNVLGFLETKARLNSDFPLLRISFLKLPHNADEIEDFLHFWKSRADLFSIQEPIYFDGSPICDELDIVENHGPASAAFQCAQPWQRLIARANGDVFPCCSLFGLDMNIGSVQRTSLEAIWNEPQLVGLRNLHRDGAYLNHPSCRQCAARSTATAVVKKRGNC